MLETLNIPMEAETIPLLMTGFMGVMGRTVTVPTFCIVSGFDGGT